MPSILSASLKRLRRYSVFALQQLLGRAPHLVRSSIDAVHLEDGCLVLHGQLFANVPINNATLTVRKFRDEHISFDMPITLTGFTKVSRFKRLLGIMGLRWMDFHVTLEIEWDRLPASIYALGISMQGAMSSLQITPKAVQILSDDVAGRTFCVFRDPAARVARIEMYHFDSNALDSLRKQATLPRPAGVHCVIGEYTNTARDNGQALFETLNADVPDIHASYIVEAKNVDNYPVAKENVCIFGSTTHLSRCLDAHVCAFTHHRTYVYPYILNVLAPQRYASTRTLFLQHGVIALKKNIIRHYHADRIRYDAFCVSSEVEKNIIISNFGYEPHKVKVTGLARFDRLYSKANTTPRHTDQILIFPTWRQGLERQTSAEVAHSQFIREWQNALRQIQALGLRPILVLHPLLRRHATLFEPYVDTILDGKAFQDALAGSAALVTDFSSVTFDALLMKKPVFMYQFAEPRTGLAQEAFIDLQTELPATLCTSVTALTGEITRSQAEDWPFIHDALRDRYFANTDDQNTTRLVHIIRQLARETDSLASS